MPASPDNSLPGLLPSAETSFARLSPRAARAVLQLFFLVAAAFVAISLSPQRTGFAEGPRFAGAPTDVDLYNLEIGAMRRGEGYYAAAARELQAAGYPTASVMNWRTPFPLWLIARLPEPAGRILLGGLALLLVAWGSLHLARERGLATGGLAAVLLFFAIMPCLIDRIYVMPVLWAGVLIGLSLCAYLSGWRTTAVALGLAALAMRDLAALYCWLAAALALRELRWKEFALWCAGFVVYALLFWWHAEAVAAHRPPDAIAHAGSWLQFGGAAFVISLAQVNGLLLSMPQPIAAVYFALALLGFASVKTPGWQRVGLAACCYVILFAFIGHSFNQYWGALFAPLLAIGVALSPQGFRDLRQAMRREETATSQQLAASSGR